MTEGKTTITNKPVTGEPKTCFACKEGDHRNCIAVMIEHGECDCFCSDKTTTGESGAELRECPFCGSYNLRPPHLQEGRAANVSCYTCGASGPSNELPYGKIGSIDFGKGKTLWNRRPAQPVATNEDIDLVRRNHDYMARQGIDGLPDAVQKLFGEVGTLLAYIDAAQPVDRELLERLVADLVSAVGQGYRPNLIDLREAQNMLAAAALPVESQPAEPTLAEIERRISDPGAFLPRGDNYNEPITRWGARAVMELLAATQPAWLPIEENTPTDKPILGGWWYNEQLWAWGQCQYDGGWYGIHGGLPTHYLPLPAPPTQPALDTSFKKE